MSENIREEIDKIVEGRLASIENLAWHHSYDWSEKDRIIREHLDYIRKDLLSHLLSQGWKSPEECKKCLEGLDVLMKPPIKKKGFVVYEDDPMYEAILARRDLDSRKLQ